MLATTIRVNIGLKEQLGFEVYFAFQNVYHFKCLSLSEEFYTVEISPFPLLGTESGRNWGWGEVGKQLVYINFKIILTSF